MMRYIVRSVLLAGACIAVVLLVAGSAADAQSDERCFEETGYCISGVIREYWETNGGLEVFGYPTSEEEVVNLYDEGTNEYQNLPVQWFQRDRLEDHTSEGLGVLAGRLGAEFLNLQHRPWETLPQVNSAPPGCVFFEQTQHSLCEPFLSYWQQNGGLERFGYPISEPMEATIWDWTGTVQYFERRRMEHHAEMASTPYEVQLGLLGQAVDYLNQEFGCFQPPPPLQVMAAAYREEVGCAMPYPQQRPYMVQPYERGEMLLVDGIGSRLSDVIFVRYYDQELDTTVADEYHGNWRRNVPETLNESPPPGLREPGYSFRKLWSENADVRNTLGWATEAEQQGEIWIQDFVRGEMFYPLDRDIVYLQCCKPRQMIEVPYLDELP